MTTRQRTILAIAALAALVPAALGLAIVGDAHRRERAADLWVRGAIRLDAIASRWWPTARHRTPPTRIGINLATPTYWNDERAFANLALSGGWRVDRGSGYREAVADDFTPGGAVRADPAIRRIAIYLARPLDPADPWIECRYDGAADLSAHGDVEAPVAAPGRVRFRWRQAPHGLVWLVAQALDSRRPLASLDCREADVPRTQRFAPAFVAFVARFDAVRFMDWERSNDNQPVTWATRHTPHTPAVTTGDGVAGEDMVALAADAGVDPWFTMPWNASDDYVVGFATYVRNHLPPGRTVYVETGNEVWNIGSLVARQAIREGIAAKLSPDSRDAGLRRYAQRTVEVMRLWERVFAREPGRLVRVASTQQVNPRSARRVLASPGLAEHVDALATADYFGLEGFAVTGDALPPIFAQLDRAMARSIEDAHASKAVAAYYGKRYLAYEAGQGVSLWGRAPLVARIERSPLMYGLYRRYLQAWRARIGDTVMLLGSTAPLKHEGWGLREFSGQPLSAAPKLRAVFDELPPPPRSGDRRAQPAP